MIPLKTGGGKIFPKVAGSPPGKGGGDCKHAIAVYGVCEFSRTTPLPLGFGRKV
ncbi:hypothetical protein ACL6C3_16625 [Capilliphycus salinus ALCB114379]|uniref:hypothetical protein n=1 Tax=Capilliphycus salinus TaxID=2768948 RepID=UPI0039A427B5